MDPLSIIAGVITILGPIVKGFERLQSFQKAPVYFSALKSEILDLEALLLGVKDILCLQQQQRLQHARGNGIVRHDDHRVSIMRAARTLEETLQKLAKWISQLSYFNEDGTFELKKTAFLRKKSQVEALRKQLERNRTDLLQCLAVTTALSSLRLECLIMTTDISAEKGLVSQACSNEETENKASLMKELPSCMNRPKIERCLTTVNVLPRNSNIFFFARMGFVDEMQKLLGSRQASVLDVEYPDNRTALWMSISYENWSTVEFLLRMGSSAAVEELCESDAYSIASEFLLAYKSRKLSYHPVLDRLAADSLGLKRCLFSKLHKAGFRSSGDSFLSVLKQTEDIDVVDAAGKTTLFWAVQADDADKVSQLLTYGADANKPSYQGRTPTHAAARAGSLSALVELLKYSPNVNAQDAFGCTPLMNALSKSNNFKVVKFLIENGADANIPNTKGWCPAHVLATYDKASWLQYIHIRGADMEIADNDGMTPLSHAICYRANNVLRFLLSLEPPVKHDRQVSGLTMLHLAALFGDSGTLEVIRASGLKMLGVLALDDKGRTAQQVALWRRDHNLDWFQEVQALGLVNGREFQLDDDPQAWFATFRNMLYTIGQEPWDG
ncbi:MAG: hypothetical protein Q9167_006064 [Letrouitia subvulpina]